jgi:hypothetical protein
MDFSGVKEEDGKLFFIPSSDCYNAGMEFIEKVLEVLMDSLQKKLHNHQPMLELYLSYCKRSTTRKITTESMMKIQQIEV